MQIHRHSLNQQIRKNNHHRWHFQSQESRYYWYNQYCHRTLSHLECLHIHFHPHFHQLESKHLQCMQIHHHIRSPCFHECIHPLHLRILDCRHLWCMRIHHHILNQLVCKHIHFHPHFHQLGNRSLECMQIHRHIQSP